MRNSKPLLGYYSGRKMGVAGSKDSLHGVIIKFPLQEQARPRAGLTPCQQQARSPHSSLLIGSRRFHFTAWRGAHGVEVWGQGQSDLGMHGNFRFESQLGLSPSTSSC